MAEYGADRGHLLDNRQRSPAGQPAVGGGYGRPAGGRPRAHRRDGGTGPAVPGNGADGFAQGIDDRGERFYFLLGKRFSTTPVRPTVRPPRVFRRRRSRPLPARTGGGRAAPPSRETAPPRRHNAVRGIKTGGSRTPYERGRRSHAGTGRSAVPSFAGRQARPFDEARSRLHGRLPSPAASSAPHPLTGRARRHARTRASPAGPARGPPRQPWASQGCGWPARRPGRPAGARPVHAPDGRRRSAAATCHPGGDGFAVRPGGRDNRNRQPGAGDRPERAPRHVPVRPPVRHVRHPRRPPAPVTPTRA